MNFCYLKIIPILHPHYHSKVIGHILKSKQKKKCVCIHEIIRLIILKMKMQKNNRSHLYDINRPRSRYRHKYSKYKNYLSMMMFICIKQHATARRCGKKYDFCKHFSIFCKHFSIFCDQI